MPVFRRPNSRHKLIQNIRGERDVGSRGLLGLVRHVHVRTVFVVVGLGVVHVNAVPWTPERYHQNGAVKCNRWRQFCERLLSARDAWYGLDPLVCRLSW